MNDPLVSMRSFKFAIRSFVWLIGWVVGWGQIQPIQTPTYVLKGHDSISIHFTSHGALQLYVYHVNTVAFSTGL